MIRTILKNFFSEKNGLNRDSGDLNSQKMLQVAATAILIEVAKSDSDFSEVEFQLIKKILQQKFSLTGEEIQQIIKTAELEREQSSDLYRFTNVINQKFNKDEKMSLMEMIWQVVYADGVLDKYEDYLAHKFATLLRLNHQELITAKLKVKNSL
jgi:uncharacterized tellurite resistance protein B-like protein